MSYLFGISGARCYYLCRSIGSGISDQVLRSLLPLFLCRYDRWILLSATGTPCSDCSTRWIIDYTSLRNSSSMQMVCCERTKRVEQQIKLYRRNSSLSYQAVSNLWLISGPSGTITAFVYKPIYCGAASLKDVSLPFVRTSLCMARRMHGRLNGQSGVTVCKNPNTLHCKDRLKMSIMTTTCKCWLNIVTK